MHSEPQEEEEEGLLTERVRGGGKGTGQWGEEEGYWQDVGKAQL